MPRRKDTPPASSVDSRHRDVPRLGAHAIEPRADARIARQVETGFIGDMRVREKRDVRDRITLADEKAARREMLLHHVERAIRTGGLLGQTRIVGLLQELAD